MRIYFSQKKNPEFFRLVTLPKKFYRKQAFTPGNSAKLCDTLWKFQDQKPKPMEIHNFSLTPLEITFLFKLIPGISACSFFNTPGNSMSLTCPCQNFSWNNPLHVKNQQRTCSSIPDPFLRF